MLKSKKGVLDQINPLLTGAVSVAITAVVVFLIMSNLAANSQVVADPNATAAVSEVQRAADDIPTYVPIIIITAIGVLLLGLVTAFQRNR